MNDNDQPGVLSQIVDWPFLQEPLWRWAVFILAVTAIAVAQNGMLGYMGAAAKEVTT